MGLKEWGIGMLVFSMVLTGLVLVGTDFLSTYSEDLGDQYTYIYDDIELNIERERNRTADMQQDVAETNINSDFTDTVSLIKDVIVTALKAPFTTMFGIFSTINLMAEVLKIPDFLLNGVIAILMLSLTILILGWIFNRRSR